MTRIYICGQLVDIEDYPPFNHAAIQLTSARYIPLNPVDYVRENPDDPKHARKTLSMLLRADGVALLPHWDSSVDAQLEVDIATRVGIPCYPLSDWLSGEVAA